MRLSYGSLKCTFLVGAKIMRLLIRKKRRYENLFAITYIAKRLCYRMQPTIGQAERIEGARAVRFGGGLPPSVLSVRARPDPTLR